MIAHGRLYRCGKLTLLYPHRRKAGCDEGLIGDYAISGSEDRLELFAIDVARGEDMAARLAGVCLSAAPPSGSSEIESERTTEVRWLSKENAVAV